MRAARERQAVNARLPGGHRVVQVAPEAGRRRKTFEVQLEHIPIWMVNMIRILVKRLRETNDKLRGIIEQYEPEAPADTGRVLTVDEDPSVLTGATTEKLFRSDEIVKDLYKK